MRPLYCRPLILKYSPRVKEFLSNPCPEWMKAMGYDKDNVEFSRQCQIWKSALKNCWTVQ